MPRRKDGEATRNRILETAAEVFARKGYRGATVAEIAAAARVNGALVIYYFGDKAALYRGAWDFASSRAAARHPVYGELGPDAPAVKKLRAVIASDIARRSDPDNPENAILLSELAAPTGFIEDAHARAMAGLRSALGETVDAILGQNVPESQRKLAVLAIFAMCAIPVEHIRGLAGDAEKSPYQLQERIEHVYNFAMAGLLDLLSRGDK